MILVNVSPKTTVFIPIGRMIVGVLQAEKMLSLPVFLAANLHLVDILKASTTFPNRHREPKFPLVILEPISVNPAPPAGKLYIIQQYQAFSLHGLKEESWPRHKIWLMACYYHNNSRFQLDARSTKRIAG